MPPKKEQRAESRERIREERKRFLNWEEKKAEEAEEGAVGESLVLYGTVRSSLFPRVQKVEMKREEKKLEESKKNRIKSRIEQKSSNVEELEGLKRRTSSFLLPLIFPRHNTK